MSSTKLVTSLPRYRNIKLIQVFLPEYQRVLDPKKIKRIHKTFNPCKVRPPLVNDRGDGTFAVVDGQHTWTVLNDRGYKEAPMAVIRVPVQEENDLFSTQHENKSPISPMERLWADSCGINGRSQRARDILEAIEAAGWQYSRDKSLKGPRTITQSTGVEHVYDSWAVENDGMASVQRALEIIQTAWPDHLEAPGPNVARAVGKLLYEYELTSAHVKTLAKLDLSKMIYKHRGKGAQANKRDTFAEFFRRHLYTSYPEEFTARGVFRKKQTA